MSITKGELIQTNQQLLEVFHLFQNFSSHVYDVQVISQKIKLGQQLENWQIDMQNVLEEQIELKLSKNLGFTNS